VTAIRALFAVFFVLSALPPAVMLVAAWRSAPRSAGALGLHGALRLAFGIVGAMLSIFFPTSGTMWATLVCIAAIDALVIYWRRHESRNA
jgi:hypothetical protein